ncbi:MAG TPA: hypothetical protein VG605_20870 [Puia sp.]|nr:hypothetical protein [Puia sp.]
MKRSLAFILVAAATFFTVACKKSSGPSAGYGASSLFPLTNGDTWYYIDSSFSDTGGAPEAYLDTMVATKATYTDASGTIYLGMNNPNGWFGGSYIAVDPNNSAVYEVDSPSFHPYIMFAMVNSDGPIARPSYDNSNPACPITYNQIGYASPVQIKGFNCYENAETITDCNNTVLEQTNYFVSPGVGVVRIEDYYTDTTGGAKKFYEDFSQTLTDTAFVR